MEKDKLEELFLERLEQSDPGGSEQHSFSKKYQRNKRLTLKSLCSESKPLRRLRPVVVIAAAAVLTLSIVAASVVFKAPGFMGIVSDDVTHMFATDNENAPDTLEKLYLFDIPDGFELEHASCYFDEIDAMFMNAEGNQFHRTQIIKSMFNHYYSTENGFEKCTVGEYPGVISQNDDMNFLAWDIGDYIMEICSDISINEILNSALSMREVDSIDWNSMLFSEKLNANIEQAYSVDIDGFTAETASGAHVVTTQLSGEKDVTVRQFDSQGWEEWRFVSENFLVNTAEVGGRPAWLVSYNDSELSMYSVLLEFNGYVFEISLAIVPQIHDDGYIYVNEMEDEAFGIAESVYNCLEMENS